jgi:hypothetical protein
MEFLEHHSVADDVLNIVGHHRKHEGDELDAESRMPHGGERAFRRRSRRRSVLGLNVQEETFFGVGGGSLMVAKPGEVFKCAKLQVCETTWHL